ncbi:MAG: diguanylate cyclase [Thermodesulfobacteriota bacterium]
MGSAEAKKALVITRDSGFREGLRSTLCEMGYDLTVREAVSHASWLFEKEEPSLILIDFDSSDGAAPGFFRKLTKCPARRYQTLMLACRPDDPQMEGGSIAGADGYLFKPATPEILRLQLFAADRHRAAIAELMEAEKKAASYRKELDLMEQQYEEAFSRANTLAVESEISRLELDQIFKAVAGGILLMDKTHKVIRINDAVSRIMGLPADEILGKKCFEASLCGPCNTSECPFSKIRKGETRVEMEAHKTCPSGEIRHYIITAAPLRTFGKLDMGIVLSITDISERVKAERALLEAKEALRESEERYRRLSIVDDLTGLFNKRRLNFQLNAEIARTQRYGRPLSLLMIDIDDFKSINDTYGHSRGDQVLSGLAQMVRQNIRDTDSAFRFGGEELVVLLPETSIEAAVGVAERLRQSSASLAFRGDSSETIVATLSIGVCQYAPGENQDALVARADRLMYQAKKEGKNRVVSDVLRIPG